MSRGPDSRARAAGESWRLTWSGLETRVVEGQESSSAFPYRPSQGPSVRAAGRVGRGTFPAPTFSWPLKRIVTREGPGLVYSI